jgi:hypothetical protein
MSSYAAYIGKWLVLPEGFWNAPGSNWAKDTHGKTWAKKFKAVRIEEYRRAGQRYGQRLKFMYDDEVETFLQTYHVDEFQDQGRFFGTPMMFVLSWAWFVCLF